MKATMCRAFQCILILWMFSGCAGGLHNQAVKPFTDNINVWPQMYRNNFQAIQSFTGKSRLTVESPQYSGNISMSTNWIAPDKLFLKAEGPLGLDVGEIFIGAHRFIVHNQHDNHFTSGSIEDPYLNRFLDTDITLKDLRFAVIGYIAQAENPLELIDPANGIFVSHEQGIEYRFLVNPQSGLLEACEARRESRVFMRQEFKNYKIVKGVFVPTIIRITLPEQQERISVFYKNIQINVPIEPDSYKIEISTKVDQLNLD